MTAPSDCAPVSMLLIYVNVKLPLQFHGCPTSFLLTHNGHHVNVEQHHIPDRSDHDNMIFLHPDAGNKYADHESQEIQTENQGY